MKFTRRGIIAGIAALLGGFGWLVSAPHGSAEGQTPAGCCGGAKRIRRTVTIHGTSDMPVTVCVKCGTVRATPEWVSEIVEEEINHR